MITYGADPEFFLRNKETGQLASSVGIIEGSKEKPSPLRVKGFFIQPDNIMGEYNIPPATGYDSFLRNIRRGLSYCREYVEQASKGTLDIMEGHSFIAPEPLLANDAARTFGCSPDFDAYLSPAGDVQAAPIDPGVLVKEEGELRFAGGHIHIGAEFNCPIGVAAQFCDYFIGLRMVEADKQPDRRALYGAPGRFRPTSYGLEYRSLSNAWIFDNTLMDTVAARTTDLAHFLVQPESNIRSVYKQIPWRDVQTAMADENEHLANQILDHCTRRVGV